ncbi:DsbC family protein [Paludibacterium denitrificans]|uniref:Thiol:disulfide interchange protein n=1 Tax=Paludibacterium denitrificans TaxID=2675226 RepID=A0A844G869_9NEIS|nr:DsbC family protein [Paludibacterium denitrificans]MTD32566.1 thioredoxin fold domain-containing protein [Paludibacterium denitrificans]HJV06707.1 DsbC family protein [Chromobacteriaceae bacterium]
MNATLKSLAMAASLLLSMAACTANAETNISDVKKAFQARFPNRQVDSVRTTPVKGLFEVVVKGKQIVYVDEKVDYVLVGDLVDAVKKESLTEKRTAELNTLKWDSLPLQYAFKEVRGNGARKMAVFTDPDCPFCRQLERESLPGVTNVTIYTFLFPLSELHPDAMHKAKQIWCSKDRAATWTAYMRDGKPLTGRDNCNTPLDKIQALGKQLGITGTPALVFANGRVVPGAIEQEQIEQLLNAK